MGTLGAQVPLKMLTIVDGVHDVYVLITLTKYGGHPPKS